MSKLKILTLNVCCGRWSILMSSALRRALISTSGRNKRYTHQPRDWILYSSNSNLSWGHYEGLWTVRGPALGPPVWYDPSRRRGSLTNMNGFGQDMIHVCFENRWLLKEHFCKGYVKITLINVCLIRCLNSIIPLVSISVTSKPVHVASLCSWAGRFESNLVTNSRRQVSTWRGSNIRHQPTCKLTGVSLLTIWGGSWDYGTYNTGDQQKLRRACASAQSRQCLRRSHT